MNLLDRPEYRFLQTNPHLGKNIIFLTCGGSCAYGTNVKGSGIDIRGCTLNSKADLLGMGNFEQVVDDHTDTTAYGFNKRLEYAKQNTSLPEAPDMARIEAFQMEVNEKVVRDEI